MRSKIVGMVSCVVLFGFIGPGFAIDANIEQSVAKLVEAAGGQQMMRLPLRVVGPDGQPVANAKIIPWALRCSQGHGLWSADDERAGVGPREVMTDENGTATVLYPLFRDVRERIHTLSVSLHIDHPDFAFIDGLHIDVPLEEKESYEAKLAPGASLEVRPMVDGKPTGLDNVFAIWSDGRSWQPGAAPEKLADGVLRFPAMSAGANSVLLVKLDGEGATYFSRIVDVELVAGDVKRIEVPLRPGVRVDGELSSNVPRPVQLGRVKACTLPPAREPFNRVNWFTWAPIGPDGTFTLDWPEGEPLQLIALCEGYHATSGAAPDVVANPPDPSRDSFVRPQVFEPSCAGRIELKMTPLVSCNVTAVDEAGELVAGVRIVSWPNVGWWNEGSQIYCHPLVRGEKLVRARKYYDAVDDSLPAPFQVETDALGKATLLLPAGNERLAVESEVYELPVFLGHRDYRVELVADRATEAKLRLQPRGTEQLGDWDKLAGVVFGCSTREGRRICALPGVQAKMAEFTKRFQEAEDPRDPRLLSEAYAVVADAFQGVGDAAEAAKWRKKADEQAAKVTSSTTE